MNAKKCDRCGAYFTKAEDGIRIMLWDTKILKFRRQDLCPSCYQDLKQWWDTTITVPKEEGFVFEDID